MKGILEKFADLAVAKPRSVIACFVVLALVGAVLGACFLRMNTDQDALISEDLDENYNRLYREFLNEAGDLEYLYLIGRVRSIDEACRFADTMAEELRGIAGVREVIGRIDLDFFMQHFLHYLPQDDLEALAQSLQSRSDLINALGGNRDLAGLFSLLEEFFDPGGLEGSDEGRMSYLLGMIERLFVQMGDHLEKDVPYRTPLGDLQDIAGTDVPPGYLFTDNRKFILVLVLPEKNYRTMSVIAEPLRQIRERMHAVRTRFPGMEIGLTGRPVLQADEMETTNLDMLRASLISVLAVSVLFIYFFRGILRPLLAVFALVVSIGIAFGLVTVLVGELNLLSVVFTIILVGLGIDFGIFLVARYQDERRRGRDPKAAVKKTLTTTGVSTVVGAVTTISAFLTAQLTDFKGLADLGLVTGLGIGVCLTAMLLLLPALLLQTDRAGFFHAPRRITFSFGRFIHARPFFILAALSLATAALAPLMHRVSFNDNLLELQSQHLESVRWERILLEESNESTWFSISFTGTLEEARALAARLALLDAVGKVETVDQALPPRMEGRERWITRIAQATKDLRIMTPAAHVDREALSRAIRGLHERVERLMELAFESGHVKAVEVLDRLRRRIERTAEGIARADEAGLKRLGVFQRRLLGEIGDILGRLQSASHAAAPTPHDLPATIRRRYVSSQHRHLVYVYPKENIWEPGPMEKFVRQIRSVDPDVTGVPIQVYESSRLVRKSFLQAGAYTLCFVGILLLLVFKNIRHVLLCLCPLAVAIVWLLIGMGLTGLQFNLANFFAIPILIGIGIDGAVHMLHRYLANRDVVLTLQSTGMPVVLTYLTTMLGFGSLMIAHHQGLASLGRLMALGSLCCLLSTILVMPSVLSLTGRLPADRPAQTAS